MLRLLCLINQQQLRSSQTATNPASNARRHARHNRAMPQATASLPPPLHHWATGTAPCTCMHAPQPKQQPCCKLHQHGHLTRPHTRVASTAAIGRSQLVCCTAAALFSSRRAALGNLREQQQQQREQHQPSCVCIPALPSFRSWQRTTAEGQDDSPHSTAPTARSATQATVVVLQTW